MYNNLIKEASSLLGMNTHVANKIIEVEKLLISDYIHTAKLQDEDVLEIDIGIGTIHILLLDTEVKYIFVPNASLEKCIINSIEGNINSLETALENSLNKVIYNTYKELL